MELVWDITRKCNLNCLHCGALDFRNAYSSKEMEDYSFFINYIGEFVDKVILLGGEPLLVKEMIEIIKLLKQKNVFVSTISNGQFSSNYAKKISQSGIDEILISIDGMQETNDIIRGIGAWQKALSFINTLCEMKEKEDLNLKIGLNIVLNKRNLSELIEIIKYFKTFDLNLIQINRLLYLGNAEKNKLDLEVSIIDELNILEDIANFASSKNIENIFIQYDYPLFIMYLRVKYNFRQETYPSPCTAWKSSIYADDLCNISPCRSYSNFKIKFEDLNKWDTDKEKMDEFISSLEDNSIYRNCLCPEVENCPKCPFKDEIINDECIEIKNRIVVFISSLGNSIKIDANWKLIKDDNNNMILKNGEEFVELTEEGYSIYLNIAKENYNLNAIAEMCNITCEEICLFILQELDQGRLKRC